MTYDCSIDNTLSLLNASTVIPYSPSLSSVVFSFFIIWHNERTMYNDGSCFVSVGRWTY